MSGTKRVNLEQTKAKAYSFPDIVFNNMLDILLVMGVDGRIAITNRAATELLGYSEEDLLERPLGDILEEDDIELFDMIRTMISKGFVRNRAITCISKNGERIPVDFNGSAMRDVDGNLVGIVGIIRDMRDIRRLLRDLEDSRDNLEIKVRLRTAALEKAKAEVEAAYRDLKHAQSRLLQSEKMASVGQLAAGVAHEINNPIGFINSNLGSLGDYIEDIREMMGRYDALLERTREGTDGDLLEIVREIDEFRNEIDLEFLMDDLSNIIDESRDGASRVKKIVADLKDFSHIDECELEFSDINRGLESTLNIVDNELRYVATVRKELGDIPQVECYPQQLNQVFMNLLINASHAIDGNGEITLRSYSDGERVFVEIGDTGRGIPPDIRERIFEPFFTTKPVGEGTGLGLSMSYNIIKNHGGNITIDSEVGKGTTFRIELPVEQGKGGS